MHSIKKWVISCILIAAMPVCAQTQAPPILSNITIVVSSCDKYSELWPFFFKHLFEQWPSLKTYNKNIPIILLTNEQAFNDKRIINIKTLQEKNWSNSMLLALQQVKTDYVLYLQEDYLLARKVDESRLQALLKNMIESNAAYTQCSSYDARFFNGAASRRVPFLKSKPKFAPYRTSLQAAIWKKQDFEWLLKPGESPWEFEFAGNLRSQGMRKDFFAVEKDTPINYINACYQGYWSQEFINYLQAKGEKLENSKLSLASEHKFSIWFSLVKLWFTIRINPYGL